MEDKKIVDLYWLRSESAISETESKYGKYCYTIAHNILYSIEDRVMRWKMKNGYFVRSAKTRPEPRYALIRYSKTSRYFALNASGKR